MLCGFLVVKQSTILDGFAFNTVSFQQDGLTAPEVDWAPVAGGRERDENVWR